MKNPTFARMGNAVFSSKQTLAILGGGQLGKMMLVKCRQWDVFTKVLDPSPTAPARLLADDFIVGDLMDYQTVVDFGQQADVVTIEIENVNIEALYTLEKQGKRFIQNLLHSKLYKAKPDKNNFMLNTNSQPHHIKCLRINLIGRTLKPHVSGKPADLVMTVLV